MIKKRRPHEIHRQPASRQPVSEWPRCGFDSPAPRPLGEESCSIRILVYSKLRLFPARLACRRPERRMFPSCFYLSKRRAYISRQCGIGHVAKSVRANRIAGAAWADKNSGTSFVDGVLGNGVVASGIVWAFIIDVNAGLRAAVNDVRFRRVPIATKIDGIEALGSANVVGLNTCIVGKSVSGVAGSGDPQLCALDDVGRDAYARRCINQNSGGAIAWRLGVASAARWVDVNVVSHVVGCDRAGCAKSDLNAVLRDG